MKILSTTNMLLLIALSFLFIRGCVRSDYAYDKKVGNYWTLAYASSDVKTKKMYIDSFINSASNLKLSKKYNAVIYKTNDCNFDYILGCVKTLDSRLDSISKVDPKSVQYQLALTQISKDDLTDSDIRENAIHSIYDLNYYPIYWDWYCILIVLGGIIYGIISIVVFFISLED